MTSGILADKAAIADVELPAVMSMLPALSASKAGAAAGKGNIVRPAKPADADRLVCCLSRRDKARHRRRYNEGG